MVKSRNHTAMNVFTYPIPLKSRRQANDQKPCAKLEERAKIVFIERDIIKIDRLPCPSASDPHTKPPIIIPVFIPLSSVSYIFTELDNKCNNIRNMMSMIFEKHLVGK